jgi:hypothetical protein
MATKEMIRGAEMAWSSEQRWPWAEMEMVACLNRDGEEEGAEIDDGLVKENPTTGTEIRGAVMPMRKRIRGAKIDGWPGADNRDGNEEDQRTRTEVMARKGIRGSDMA